MQIPSQNVKKLAFFNENIPPIVVSMETICVAKLKKKIKTLWNSKFKEAWSPSKSD